MADPVYTTTYEADNDGLNVIETPDVPVPKTTRHSIRELRAEKARCTAAIGSWQEKKAAIQVLIDAWNAAHGK